MWKKHENGSVNFDTEHIGKFPNCKFKLLGTNFRLLQKDIPKQDTGAARSRVTRIILCVPILYLQIYLINHVNIKCRHSSTSFSTDHCVDYIRQALMCFAGVSPTSFYFDPKRGNKPRTEGLHMCQNYDRIKDWALDRQVFYFSQDNETLSQVIGMDKAAEGSKDSAIHEDST
jgi:hypothetical protein